MPTLTPEAHDAWLGREKRMVLTTTDADGVPNAIWILCAELMDGDKFVIANNAMHKTLENIEGGGKASLLFIAPWLCAHHGVGRGFRASPSLS